MPYVIGAWRAAGTDPVAVDTELSGGLHVVADGTERLDIEYSRRKIGMRVVQSDTPNIVYKLLSLGTGPNDAYGKPTLLSADYGVDTLIGGNNISISNGTASLSSSITSDVTRITNVETGSFTILSGTTTTGSTAIFTTVSGTTVSASTYFGLPNSAISLKNEGSNLGTITSLDIVGNGINAAVVSNAGTITISDAGASSAGVITTGTQTFAGAKTFNSGITGSINGNAATVTDGVYTTSTNVITNAMLRDSTATSVIGRSAGTNGDPADISTATDNHVLRRSGGTLGFGTLANASLQNSSVTIGSTGISLGSSATTIGGLVSITSTGFTGSLNGNADTVTNGVYITSTNAVTNAMLRDSAATSVIGRSANSSGDPADISTATDNHVLRRSGGVLGFGTLANTSLQNSSVRIGITDISLGGDSTTIAGLSSVTSTGFTGSLNGNANTVTNGVYTTGDQTIGGTKTFTSTIAGNINGNAATVTNGVYTTGNQTIGGTKTFTSTIAGNINGNAATVTNGVYTTGDQTIDGIKTFSSNLIVQGNTTIGNSSLDTLTINALNVSIPNNLNFGTNRLYIHNSQNNVGIGKIPDSTVKLDVDGDVAGRLFVPSYIPSYQTAGNITKYTQGNVPRSWARIKYDPSTNAGSIENFGGYGISAVSITSTSGRIFIDSEASFGRQNNWFYHSSNLTMELGRLPTSIYTPIIIPITPTELVNGNTRFVFFVRNPAGDAINFSLMAQDYGEVNTGCLYFNFMLFGNLLGNLP
jgi:hypothetical protein